MRSGRRSPVQPCRWGWPLLGPRWTATAGGPPPAPMTWRCCSLTLDRRGERAARCRRCDAGDQDGGVWSRENHGRRRRGGPNTRRLIDDGSTGHRAVDVLAATARPSGSPSTAASPLGAAAVGVPEPVASRRVAAMEAFSGLESLRPLQPARGPHPAGERPPAPARRLVSVADALEDEARRGSSSFGMPLLAMTLRTRSSGARSIATDDRSPAARSSGGLFLRLRAAAHPIPLGNRQPRLTSSPSITPSPTSGSTYPCRDVPAASSPPASGRGPGGGGWRVASGAPPVRPGRRPRESRCPGPG